ncbi:MAG: xanthine dehydrogenase family protein molybdopterin-binding subunit [Acidimicrobiia bacterium]|nr:xanthine dehydrogenase family protein molybdopterin-binding subunit [Acidimicrobiia bacterium]MDH4308845.1 xanthine dehydrogenase family protein molybdopterin-binding subunit [Acidimicrobiia bacterium]MDH5292695.1 xanthine dehydrogenase family protein molybdopterin-binding subunit [Acidimicrobiia bacterium]
MSTYIGKSMKRVEDPRFVQGKGRYVANLALPGMIHVAVKRSPFAHARIASIDGSAAEALDGVIAVYTGQDLLDSGVGSLPCGFTPPGIKTPPHHPLAVDKVRHVGDGVAVVVAEDPYVAEDAVDLIRVDYEPLAAVVDARKAMDDGAPLVHDDVEQNLSFHWPLGDADATAHAIESADHVVQLEFSNQRLIPNAMEPRACAAQWDGSTESMTVWTTSQNPHTIRLLLGAFTLGIPEHKLRVISPDVGGGFGSKIFHYAEEVIVPWVARAVGRPAKWVASRSEAFITDAHGRDHVTRAELAVTQDGTFTGLRVTTWANMGAYLSTFAPLIPTALYITLLSGLYKIPAIFGEAYGTMTNTVPVDAYRGAGRPEASYLVETLVDLAARDLGMDPIELRRKNLIAADEFPYQTPVALAYDSGDYQRLFDKAEELSEYGRLRRQQEEARAAGRLVGIGFSGCIEASGPAPSAVAVGLGAAIGLYESGVVRVHPTGKVVVLTGSHSHGQGHETTFAQIVADELGVPIDDVEVVHGDTDRTPYGVGTYGSRSAAIGGSALVKSAEKIRAKLTELAAHLVEASVEDMVYDRETGTISVQGSPETALGFAQLAFALTTADNLPEGMEPGLEATSFYDPANFTFPCSAHVAQVEIDRDTGEVTVVSYAAVDDVGNVVNPMIVEGQILGGIAQGVGQALWEHGMYDDSGQLLAGSMMDYAMPRADGFPPIAVDRIETPSPHNPLGIKGAGEMGTIAGTATISSAVLDALAPLGIRYLEMPLTAEKIHDAIVAATEGGGA